MTKLYSLVILYKGDSAAHILKVPTTVLEIVIAVSLF